LASHLLVFWGYLPCRCDSRVAKSFRRRLKLDGETTVGRPQGLCASEYNASPTLSCILSALGRICRAPGYFQSSPESSVAHNQFG
jgi:hypothetical protein